MDVTPVSKMKASLPPEELVSTLEDLRMIGIESPSPSQLEMILNRGKALDSAVRKARKKNLISVSVSLTAQAEEQRPPFRLYAHSLKCLQNILKMMNAPSEARRVVDVLANLDPWNSNEVARRVGFADDGQPEFQRCLDVLDRLDMLVRKDHARSGKVSIRLNHDQLFPGGPEKAFSVVNLEDSKDVLAFKMSGLVCITFCKPSRKPGKRLHKLAKKNASKIAIGLVCREDDQEFSRNTIQEFPTSVLYWKGQEVDRVEVPDYGKVQSMLDRGCSHLDDSDVATVEKVDIAATKTNLTTSTAAKEKANEARAMNSEILDATVEIKTKRRRSRKKKKNNVAKESDERSSGMQETSIKQAKKVHKAKKTKTKPSSDSCKGHESLHKQNSTTGGTDSDKQDKGTKPTQLVYRTGSPKALGGSSDESIGPTSRKKRKTSSPDKGHAEPGTADSGLDIELIDEFLLKRLEHGDDSDKTIESNHAKDSENGVAPEKKSESNHVKELEIHEDKCKDATTSTGLEEMAQDSLNGSLQLAEANHFKGTELAGSNSSKETKEGEYHSDNEESEGFSEHDTNNDPASLTRFYDEICIAPDDRLRLATAHKSFKELKANKEDLRSGSLKGIKKSVQCVVASALDFLGDQAPSKLERFQFIGHLMKKV